MDEHVQNYLEKLLTKSSSYQLTPEEASFIKKSGIETYIYAKLTSKKFRKYKMTGASVEHTKNAIALSVSKDQPLQIVYPQGGYKLWRLPSSPETDWAEFFVLAYVLSYIAPIAAAYKPGVHITFYLHTLLMEKHDNLTTEEIQKYVDTFQALMDAFKKHLPKNISLALLRDADIYTRDDYFTLLEEARKEVAEEYPNWPQKQKDDFARMARLNIKWEGQGDWTKLSNEEQEHKVYLAALYEQAVSKLQKVNERVKSPENILLFTKAAGNFIGIGSTKASIAKYWVGYGVLVKKDDSFQPVVLTPNQYELTQTSECITVDVNVVESKNYASIRIFTKPLLFM